MNRTMRGWPLAAPGALALAAALIALGAAPRKTAAGEPGPEQGAYEPAPTMTAQALRIEHLEAQLEQCRGHHSTCFDYAGELYEQLESCRSQLRLRAAGSGGYTLPVLPLEPAALAALRGELRPGPDRGPDANQAAGPGAGAAP